MEENKNDILRHSATYGAIIGFALIIYSVLLYIADLSLSRALGYVSYVIIIAGIFLSIKRFRENEPSDAIKYGKALGVGVLTCVFMGFIGAVFTYVHFKFIDPDLINKILEMTQDKLLDRGLSEDMIEMQSEFMMKFMSSGMMAVSAFINYIFMGTVFSLILAAILKKEPNPVESQ
ncbi:MAG: DUF4199 domain-containing protein [Bacteroidales bacterium]|nr:MAG: DUF4199 domain-containing protein [Bacteroidales bacterium]